MCAITGVTLPPRPRARWACRHTGPISCMGVRVQCSGRSKGVRAAQAFLGLQRTEGLGVMSYDPSTLVTLGGCAPKHEARPRRCPAAQHAGSRIYAPTHGVPARAWTHCQWSCVAEPVSCGRQLGSAPVGWAGSAQCPVTGPAQAERLAQQGGLQRQPRVTLKHKPRYKPNCNLKPERRCTRSWCRTRGRFARS